MGVGRFQFHFLGIHRRSNSLPIPPEFSSPCRIRTVGRIRNTKFNLAGINAVANEISGSMQ